MDYKRIARIMSEDSEYYRRDYKKVGDFVMYLLRKYGTTSEIDYALTNKIKSHDKKYWNTGVWMSDSFISALLTCGDSMSDEQKANRIQIMTEE